jgi:hypothetical protein
MMPVSSILLEQIENGWSEEIIEVDAAAVSLIDSLQEMKNRGYEFRWVQIHRVRELTFSGWEPVIEERSGRRAVYMNKMPTRVRADQDLILIMRDTAEFAAGQALLSKEAPRS